MIIQKEHKMWHYTLHFTLAAFTLLFLVFSDSIFFKKNTYGNNLVFGDSSTTTIGNVQKNLSFETITVHKNGKFFPNDFFSVPEKSELEINFSDFTVMRTGENTKLSVENSQTPGINLQKGKIWVATKEYISVKLDHAMVETIAGSALIEKKTNGIFLVTAWDKPSKITFFNETDGSTLWEFLLPSQHQIQFSPNLFFSQQEFERFSLSKLQKEFKIQKIEESKFITQNIMSDIAWNAAIIREIEKRKSSKFNIDIKASIFEFSPNIKNQELHKNKREEVMTIWDTLSQKNFSLVESKITNMSNTDKKRFMRYAGFFPENNKSFPIFLKSFPVDMDSTWKKYWHLEAFLQSNGGLNPQPILTSFFEEIEKKSSIDLEQDEFLTLALFKNYPEKINIPIIRWLNKVDTNLIAKMQTKEEKITKKLEVVQSIFSITDNLVAKQKFVIARQMLDNMDMNSIMDEEVGTLFAQVASKVSNQKDYKRGEVEYAEILGDNERKDFDKYLVIKNRLLEKSNFHAAPKVEYTEENIIKELRIMGIFTKSAIQHSQKRNIFILQSAKNAEGVRFSGLFDAKKKKITELILHQEGKNDITKMKDFAFSLEEILQITPEQVSLLSAIKPEKETVEVTPEKRVIIPSEIIDFVSRISQNDFIAHDIMVDVNGLEVTSITTAKITNAIPHFLAIKTFKDELKKTKWKKKKSYYNSVESPKLQWNEYTISFEYNVDSKKASEITAKYIYPEDPEKEIHSLSLTGDNTVEEMISQLDTKTDAIKNLYKTKETIRSQLQLSGFTSSKAEIDVISPHYADITDIIHTRTKVRISGKYNPKKQIFLSFSITNIADSLQTVDSPTSLQSISKQFLDNAEELESKVSKWKRKNGK